MLARTAEKSAGRDTLDQQHQQVERELVIRRIKLQQLLFESEASAVLNLALRPPALDLNGSPSRRSRSSSRRASPSRRPGLPDSLDFHSLRPGVLESPSVPQLLSLSAGDPRMPLPRVFSLPPRGPAGFSVPVWDLTPAPVSLSISRLFESPLSVPG
ncbi:hypothetical protein F4818DRAFT_442624 [Hypoxylon cercidicola]|nr:hypothetical protein F4818DRAFT_442624 [Hypoxylon cercidicola]